MCLTPYLIDGCWNMPKIILNFLFQITKVIHFIKLLKHVFLDLGIGRVFFITIDDAIFNDTILTYVKKCIIGQGSVILESKYLPMRYGALILNLIVEQGLKEYNTSTSRIYVVVIYVTGPQLDYKKFRILLRQKNSLPKSLSTQMFLHDGIQLGIEQKYQINLTKPKKLIKFEGVGWFQIEVLCDLN